MDNYKIIDGKKFMWDGKAYDTEKEAEEVKSTYEKDKFETQMLSSKEGKYFVYTRRVVTEVVVEGTPPI